MFRPTVGSCACGNVLELGTLCLLMASRQHSSIVRAVFLIGELIAVPAMYAGIARGLGGFAISFLALS